jgi:hypothetical protein
MIAVAVGNAGRYSLRLLAPGALMLVVAFLASIGVPQWLVLRRHLPNAVWWIPANAIAWLVGVAVHFMVLALFPDGSSFWLWTAAGIVSGVLMGVVVCAVT